MPAAIELADVFLAAGPAYCADGAGHLDQAALKVMAAIEQCRTASLGGHGGGFSGYVRSGAIIAARQTGKNPP